MAEGGTGPAGGAGAFVIVPAVEASRILCETFITEGTDRTSSCSWHSAILRHRMERLTPEAISNFDSGNPQNSVKSSSARNIHRTLARINSRSATPIFRPGILT